MPNDKLIDSVIESLPENPACVWTGETPTPRGWEMVEGGAEIS